MKIDLRYWLLNIRTIGLVHRFVAHLIIFFISGEPNLGFGRYEESYPGVLRTYRSAQYNLFLYESLTLHKFSWISFSKVKFLHPWHSISLFNLGLTFLCPCALHRWGFLLAKSEISFFRFIGEGRRYHANSPSGRNIMQILDI